MAERDGVIVRDGETVGACLVEVLIDGAVVLSSTVHWSLAPAELVELLREHVSVRADAYRAQQAAVPPASPPRDDRRSGGLRLIS